ncbi:MULTISPECIES: type I polyketide synthase [Amycolatopsis]|uniref:Type I polyketide synthase n=1 Tax=Amycolatopsis albidoflavus TaxID=102226 RepID=A0ABW5HS92_9PSEU
MSTVTERPAGALPIAVVGMACRFPGANGVEQLWELLRTGTDASMETPPDRYDADSLYSAEPAPGRVISRRAGYLRAPDLFDAKFFGMSRGEASNLDPQQRLLLTTAWEALEDAGLVPDRLAGSRTGVYVGSMHTDYWDIQARRGLDALNPSAVYNYRCQLSGRLSYAFDLRGPSITLDTACSSSLVAIHLACQSLRAGETTLALAAGVNLKLIADEDVLLSQVRMLAPDGRCKFGDATANGFAPSDGVGVVVLKPLAAALADGDAVHAVIRGSAVGNDGASSGSVLAPSVEGHIDMLRWAYENAGVDPADVDFVEAHGTGTPMIDPVEFAGLGTVLGASRPPDQPCFVGSVKTNIGHTEGAAGIAALIKTVLCLKHRKIVPSLHYDNPNPAIPWADLPLVVPRELTALPDRGRLPVAGISGQGISSVNTHIVVEAADPAWTSARPAAGTDQEHLLVLSARTRYALDELARAYADFLSTGRADLALRDVCHTAANRRQHHSHRLAAVGSSPGSLARKLRAFLGGKAGADVRVGEAIGEHNGLPQRSGDLVAAAHAYVQGRPIVWSDVVGDNGTFVRVPTYPWENRSYWLDPVERTAAAGSAS